MKEGRMGRKKQGIEAERKPRTIAYLRMSTDGQDLEKNKADILKLANDKDFGKVEFVEEVVSGRISWRLRKIADIIDHGMKGDRLIVSELSRLGRSMLEVMQILAVANDKGMEVYAIKGGWELNNSLQSKVMAMVFSIAAEIERELISLRTKESLATKRAQGIRLGRPPGPGKSKLDQYRPEIEALLKNGSRKNFVAKRYGATNMTLSNWIRKNNIDAIPTL
jgi:DNA invertase Pin-like site-specific DNA recombinase